MVPFIRRAVLAGLLGAVFVAPAAFADATPTLLPGDEGASAIVDPAPGQQVTATVEPAGCLDPAACDYTVTADGGPAPTNVAAAAQRHSTVMPVNGATVKSVSSRPRKHTRVRGRHRSSGAPSARAAIAFEYWGYGDDSICSVYGCWAWRMTLGASAWCDYPDSWCWGTRSRYSRTGDINCGWAGNVYVVSRNDCSDHNDPSKTDFYADFNGTVSAIAYGYPFAGTHFLHRHYTRLNTWLATG